MVRQANTHAQTGPEQSLTVRHAGDCFRWRRRSRQSPAGGSPFLYLGTGVPARRNDYGERGCQLGSDARCPSSPIPLDLRPAEPQVLRAAADDCSWAGNVPAGLDVVDVVDRVDTAAWEDVAERCSLTSLTPKIRGDLS